MEILTEYGWIISLIGLCLNVLILLFCRNKSSLKIFENSLNHLFMNDNIASLITQLLTKSDSNNQELIDSLRVLLEYIKGDKK